MMRIHETDFSGVKIIELNHHADQRGAFVKIFNDKEYREMNLDFQVDEIFYSISKKGVIRGMHYQAPPFQHDKVVHVVSGHVIDVVMDIRKDSTTFLKCMGVDLSGSIPRALYIPKGFAHGFVCLEDDTIMVYQVSVGYHQEADTGIRFDSIDYDWRMDMPIVSERDAKLPLLSDWKSPF